MHVSASLWPHKIVRLSLKMKSACRQPVEIWSLAYNKNKDITLFYFRHNINKIESPAFFIIKIDVRLRSLQLDNCILLIRK